MIVRIVAACAVGVLILTGALSSRASAQPQSVRLALVNVPDDLLRPLLPMFQQRSGITATIVYTGQDPYGVARRGGADVVISHFGHEGVAPFVTEGLGLWPHAVFANQMALFGPPGDPAKVRGLSSASEAFQRIASTKSRFIVNDSAGAKYIEDIVANAVLRSGDWYVDSKLVNRGAVDAASKAGGYVLWGVPPFLRLKREQGLNLEPLVVADPIFQRIMVSVVVNPAKVAGVNAKAAQALENYLLAPSTQAWIAAFRYPELAQQVWWPAGRHNSARE
jgi:tungstate transport system substrate-binding protein